MSLPEVVVLHNARIVAQPSRPAFSGSIVLRDGLIEAVHPVPAPSVGTFKPQEVIDLRGKTILPGLVDSHLHFELYTLALDLLDCEVGSLDECLARVRDRAGHGQPEEWICGHGWNDNEWERPGSRRDLDAVAQGHPVYLTAKSLHAGWANSEALRAAGVDSAVPDPPDGKIVRGGDGSPTGILLEGAMRLVSSAIPRPTPAALATKMEAAQERLWRMGLTGIHDFDGSRCFTALQLLREAGRLGLRVVKNLPYADLEAAISLGLRSGFGDEWIRLGQAKVFADGALGPRTAAMLEPYDDVPGATGISLLDDEELLEKAIHAGEHGWGMAIHAIGDRANHVVLNAMTALRREEKERAWPARRHRIEHLQLLHESDVQRPARLGLIASMQPLHATSDMVMADRGWGARVRTAYAWRSQLRHGAHLAFGSDAPVESPNPFWGLHAAVTRRRADGSPGPSGWVPGEILPLGDALAAYTSGAAYAAGWEDRSGTLQSGRWADLIVLEEDPFQVGSDGLREMAPVGVMTGGVWRVRDF